MQSVKADLSARCFYYLTILLTCLSFSSYAEKWSDNLHLNGYFSFDMSIVDTEFITVSTSHEFRQYEQDKISIKNSLIGGQLEYQFNDNLSAFAQGAAFYDENGSGKADVNWAYLSYDFGRDFKVRAGVFQIPFLQGTELRGVGYSRLWARPLTPGNGASGFNTYQGIDLLKHISFGEYHWDFQLAAGKAKHDLNEVDADGLELFSARLSYQQFWLRAALLHAKYLVSTPRGQVIIDSGNVLMASIEAEAMFGQVIINAGLSSSDSDVTPDDTMYYFSMAYAFDEITPYTFFAKQNQHFVAFEIPNAGGTQLPPPPPMQNRPTPPDGDDNSYSVAVGARWNFAEQLALKVQLENNRTHAESGPAETAIKKEGNIFSLVIEGVF